MSRRAPIVESPWELLAGEAARLRRRLDDLEVLTLVRSSDGTPPAVAAPPLATFGDITAGFATFADVTAAFDDFAGLAGYRP